VALQPVPDGVPVDAQLAGDLGERPRLLGDAVSQVRLEAGEAELDGPLGKVLVGGAAALAGAAGRAWGAVDAGLAYEAADHIIGGMKLAGQLRQAGVCLAACHEVAVQVGEPEGVGAVVEAALLAVDDGDGLRLSLRYGSGL
jgi:hypothetical protein